MKTKTSFFYLWSFIFGLILSPVPCALSQIPQGFNYQAIARDGTGAVLPNTSLQAMMYVQSLSTGGTIFWKELHSTITTNSFGLFTLVVGTGTRQTESTVATFNLIDWSVTPKYLKTEIYYSGSWKDMGTSQLMSVPYAMTSGDLTGTVDKLAVKGTTSGLEEALFEVKNKDGQTIFAVYNEGVRIYVDDGAKGPKGGFAVGGFDMTKGTKREYLVVSDDSIRMYLDSNPSTKGKKGGFAVGGYDLTKGSVQNYLDVSADSIRMYVDTDPSTKKVKGGFAVGGYDMTKGPDEEFLRVTADSVKVSKSLLIPRLSLYERDHLPFVPGDALIIFNTTESCMQIFKNNVWSNIWCFNCAPNFIIQPVDNTICSGNDVTMFVSASGMNLNYQWQQSTDNENTWTDMLNGGSNPAISGVKSYTLILTNVPVGYHSYKYRCLVSGSCPPNVNSNSVTLNVGSTPPTITTQPADQQLSTGCIVNFTIVSPGYSVSYKWQQSVDGGSSWSNIADGGTGPIFSGSTTSTLSLSNVPLACNNNKYRCTVSNLCGTEVTSTVATLAINILPVITVQPINKLIYAGYDITFSIATSGSGYNYQWQESTNGGDTWSNVTNGGLNPTYAGATTTGLSLSKIPLTYNNNKYRCIVSHYCQPNAISDAATLSVPTPGPVSDIDGNIYNTVGIGSQLWMAENLKTTKFNDGTAISYITNTADWYSYYTNSLTTPAYCWYGDDEINYKPTYGAMYNWFTVNASSNGGKNVCPTGWHVPTDAEWTTLSTCLGGESVAGGKLKEIGTTHWNDPNTGATNESGFTALPGGNRNYDGSFNSFGTISFMWTTTEYLPASGWNRFIRNYEIKLGRNSSWKVNGLSIRCIKDN